MARETTISGIPFDDDESGDRPSYEPSGMDSPEFDDELRPSRLEDVVGQADVVERIRILLQAAQKRREPLGHLLLDGPPGLGKTTLATVIPKDD